MTAAAAMPTTTMLILRKVRTISSARDTRMANIRVPPSGYF